MAGAGLWANAASARTCKLYFCLARFLRLLTYLPYSALISDLLGPESARLRACSSRIEADRGLAQVLDSNFAP